jgi:hypothetical protein
VDLRSLYDSIVRCLEGSDSACEKLGLNREIQKISKKIVGNNLKKPIEVNKNKAMQEILNKLMEEDRRNLLFTLASSGGEIIENRRLIDHIVSAYKILRGYA